MRTGRLDVVFASVGCFLLVPLLLPAQLAVSSGEVPAAHPSNFFPSDLSGRDDGRQDAEKEVLREERPGASVAQEFTPPPEETWHHDRPAKRQRRGSSRSPSRWLLSRSSSRSRKYRPGSDLLAAVTSMTAALFLLWRLWSAVSRCLEQSPYNTSGSPGTTPRLLANSEPPAEPFTECVATEVRNLSSGDPEDGENPPAEDEVKSAGEGAVGEEDKDAESEGGNPPEEDNADEGANPILASDGGESGGIPAQKKRRRSAVAVLAVILRVASSAIIAAGLIACICFLSRSIFLGRAHDSQTAKIVIAPALLAGALLRVFADLLVPRFGKRKSTPDASTPTEGRRMSPMEKRFVDFFILFAMPVLAVIALQNDESSAPWILMLVAVLVLSYSIGASVQRHIARGRLGSRIANL